MTNIKTKACSICGGIKKSLQGQYCYKCGPHAHILKKSGVALNSLIERTKYRQKLKGKIMQQDILDEIIKSPGIKPNQLLERVTIHRHALYDQLKRLERWNKIEKVRDGHTYQCFPKREL